MPPSPKLHRRVEIVPVEASVNETFSGAVPVVGLPLNSATGGGMGATSWCQYWPVVSWCARTTRPVAAVMLCLVELGLLMRNSVLESRMRIVPVPLPKLMLESGEVFSNTSPVSWPVMNTCSVLEVSFTTTQGRVMIGVGVVITKRLHAPAVERAKRSMLLPAFLPARNTRPSLCVARLMWSSVSPELMASIADQVVSDCPSMWNEKR